MAVLLLVVQAVRAAIRVAEEGILALLRSTRWLLNRFRL